MDISTISGSPVAESRLDLMPRDGVSAGIPAVNIIETDSSFFVELSLPGYQKMNLIVKVESQQLLIRGNGTCRPYRNIVRTIQTEFVSQPFIRTFRIPEGVKELVSWLDSGVLYVQMLKGKDTHLLLDKEILIQ